jgi:imidazolonepropionase-like amidohydrolase
MFGVADELGALEVGKAADVVVFSGDPLEESGRVEMVFVGGERIREPGP